MTHKIPNAQINDEISQKQFQISRPVHVFFKTDKLDYLQSSKTKLFFESCFSIGEDTSSTGKQNWNLLGFSSFISILGQCEKAEVIYVFFNFFKINCQHLKLTVYKMQNIPKESLNCNGVKFVSEAFVFTKYLRNSLTTKV